MQCTNFVDMSDSFKYEHSKKSMGWGTTGDTHDGVDLIDDSEIDETIIGTGDQLPGISSFKDTLRKHLSSNIVDPELGKKLVAPLKGACITHFKYEQNVPMNELWSYLICLGTTIGQDRMDKSEKFHIGKIGEKYEDNSFHMNIYKNRDLL